VKAKHSTQIIRKNQKRNHTSTNDKKYLSKIIVSKVKTNNIRKIPVKIFRTRAIINQKRKNTGKKKIIQATKKGIKTLKCINNLNEDTQ